ncbi:hypothetical protein [Vibrio sp. 10N]|uniref:hypothetical protein n=1 Tax=Vibrio sp. 10N TaxID=3058938 RepID=UPI002814720A|nr:hypothetical protein VB10N_26790 [Vibrio sp. 10N]
MKTVVTLTHWTKFRSNILDGVTQTVTRFDDKRHKSVRLIGHKKSRSIERLFQSRLKIKN